MPHAEHYWNADARIAWVAAEECEIEMPSAAPRRRFLALVYPALSIERLRGTRAHLCQGVPVAIAERVGATERLIAVDAAAARAGLAIGMTVAAALAAAPEAMVVAQDPHADLDWLERLALGCTRYGRPVAAMPPDGVVIEVGDADERAIAADVEARAARRGVVVRTAPGDTAGIALALARHAGGAAPDEAGAVRRLPIAALGLEPEDAEALAAAGLRTMGEALAKPALAARFGAAAAIRELIDDAPLPVPRRTVVAIAERHLTEPILGGADALAVLEALAGETIATLPAWQGGRCWRALLFRQDGQLQSIAVEIAPATRDAAVMARRIGAAIDAIEGGCGYDLVRVELMRAAAVDAGRLRLEGGAGAAPAARQRRRRNAAPPPEQVELTLPAPAAPSAPTDAGDAPRPIFA